MQEFRKACRIECRKTEHSAQNQTRYDMPDAPPCSYEYHAALGNLRREYAGIEQQQESQSGVLDTGLDSDGATVLHRSLAYGGSRITDSESYQIVYEDYNENKSYVFLEKHEVL